MRQGSVEKKFNRVMLSHNRGFLNGCERLSFCFYQAYGLFPLTFKSKGPNTPDREKRVFVACFNSEKLIFVY